MFWWYLNYVQCTVHILDIKWINAQCEVAPHPQNWDSLASKHFKLKLICDIHILKITSSMVEYLWEHLRPKFVQFVLCLFVLCATTMWFNFPQNKRNNPSSALEKKKVCRIVWRYLGFSSFAFLDCCWLNHFRTIGFCGHF